MSSCLFTYLFVSLWRVLTNTPLIFVIRTIPNEIIHLQSSYPSSKYGWSDSFTQKLNYTTFHSDVPPQNFPGQWGPVYLCNLNLNHSSLPMLLLPRLPFRFML